MFRQGSIRHHGGSESDPLNQEAGVQKGIWIPTKFNDWGTPIVPIRKKGMGSKVKL